MIDPDDNTDDIQDEFVDASDNTGIKILPPFIFLGFFILAVALDLMIGFNLLIWGFQLSAGVLLMSLGAFLMSWSFFRFQNAMTSVDVRKPASDIVTDGPYAYSRNPIYLGMVFVYLGLVILFDLFYGFVLLIPMIYILNTQIIEREESYLSRKFGASYEDYKSHVRRWI